VADRPQLIGLRRLEEADSDLVFRFLQSLPEGDRTFFKEETDIESIRRSSHDERVARWLLVGDDGEPQALLALIRGVGWSAHVGELRLVVGQAHRRRGLGRALARAGLLTGVRMGLRKLTVEVVADKEGDLRMFTAIGFEPEALLQGHIIDRAGHIHDLVVLSHDVDAVREDLELIGVDEAIGGAAP
jgi:RimJ/RimL family protein N-acetyltransferase